VLIASISFVGYFAARIAGARRGIVYTALFGGLASSTALTLHFSRASRDDRAMAPLLAAGILIACGTMMPRLLLVSSLFKFDLFMPLLLPTLVMSLLTYVPAFMYWSKVSRRRTAGADSPLKNPLELRMALSFGVLLVLVLLLGRTLKNTLGDASVLALAAASGMADVDAITLSLAQMSQDDLAVQTAAAGIVIAAVVNNIVKASIAIFIGGRKVGLLVGLPLIISSAAGLLLVWL
jgi:uncharacterized membrane protein (DUF4010 family)